MLVTTEHPGPPPQIPIESGLDRIWEHDIGILEYNPWLWSLWKCRRWTLGSYI